MQRIPVEQRERKTEMNPSSKKSAFYSLPFLSFSRSYSFFLLSGFVVVALHDQKLFSSSSSSFFLHPTTFCCIYAPVFIRIQPSDRRISCALFLHTYTEEKEERERKNTSKKLRVRAISSKNVVIVVRSEITMDCQEKPESSTKKDQRAREREKKDDGGWV